MNKKLTNLAIIGGNNHLPLYAYNSVKKNFDKFIYINISNQNKKKIRLKKFVYNLKIYELEKCISLLNKHNISQVCFLGSVNRPDLSRLKLDNILIKYINDLTKSSKEGDGNILDTIVNIFSKEGFLTKSFVEIFPNDYLLNKEVGIVSSSDKDDIKKGVSILNSLSKFDNAQACVVSNGYVLAIEAVEGTDKMLSRVKSIKKKISRDFIEGSLIKIPKGNQNLKIDLPTIGVRTLEMMHSNKLSTLAIKKNLTIVVDKRNFYKKLKKLNIKLFFIN